MLSNAKKYVIFKKLRDGLKEKDTKFRELNAKNLRSFKKKLRC